MEIEIKDTDGFFERVLKKYIAVKCRNPGAILFFSHKDFYSSFFDDAVFLSDNFRLPIYNPRNIPMIQIPVEDANHYMQRIAKQARCVKVPGL